MTAWYKNNMADFVARDVEDIVNTLVSQSVGKIPSDMVGYQRQSWRNTINGLVQTSKIWMQDCPEAREWSVLLEYELPRRNRRIDAVILARDIVILIEFKDESIRAVIEANIIRNYHPAWNIYWYEDRLNRLMHSTCPECGLSARWCSSSTCQGYNRMLEHEEGNKVRNHRLAIYGFAINIICGLKFVDLFTKSLNSF